jgi:hypothetical protein
VDASLAREVFAPCAVVDPAARTETSRTGIGRSQGRLDWVDTPSGQDADFGVWPVCERKPEPSRPGKAGDLQLPRVHPHLWEDQGRKVYRPPEDDAHEAAGEAERGVPEIEATHARSAFGTGCLPAIRRRRAYPLLRVAHEWILVVGLPRGGWSIVVASAQAAKPEAPYDLGPDETPC